MASASADGKNVAPVASAAPPPFVVMTVKTVESQLQELSALCKQSVDKCAADYKSQVDFDPITPSLFFVCERICGSLLAGVMDEPPLHKS